MTRWADLAPDLLGDISAVCTSWRDALLSVMTTLVSRPPFLPRLLTPFRGLIFYCTVDFGCTDSSKVSSMSSYQRSREDVVLMEPPGASIAHHSHRNWVASANGTDAWLFTDTRLLNVLTGAVTRLPKLPETHNPRIKLHMENLCGIIYGDSTIFLYHIVYEFSRYHITAAILRPGNAAWMLGSRALEFSGHCTTQPGAAYHNGKILVFIGVQHWCVLTLDDTSRGGIRLDTWWNASLWHKYVRDDCYVMESNGELLWVSVLAKPDKCGGNNTDDDPASVLSLTVHALEEQVAGSGNMHWVERDGRTLVDRILLLGAPARIVVDATQLSVAGGRAYFVFRRGLFRYSFVDGEAKLLKQLRPVYGTDKACLWLQPQPAIAPIHEIRKRIEAPKKTKQRLPMFGKSDV